MRVLLRFTYIKWKFIPIFTENDEQFDSVDPMWNNDIVKYKQNEVSKLFMERKLWLSFSEVFYRKQWDDKIITDRVSVQVIKPKTHVALPDID